MDHLLERLRLMDGGGLIMRTISSKRVDPP